MLLASAMTRSPTPSTLAPLAHRSTVRVRGRSGRTAQPPTGSRPGLPLRVRRRSEGVRRKSEGVRNRYRGGAEPVQGGCGTGTRGVRKKSQGVRKESQGVREQKVRAERPVRSPLILIAQSGPWRSLSPVDHDRALGADRPHPAPGGLEPSHRLSAAAGGERAAPPKLGTKEIRTRSRAQGRSSPARNAVRRPRISLLRLPAPRAPEPARSIGSSRAGWPRTWPDAPHRAPPRLG